MKAVKVTAFASANIAFIKYWGNRDASLRLPYNSSLSMNLSAATTTTTVQFDNHLPNDTVIIGGEEQHGPVRARVVAHLDRVRALAGSVARALVISQNSFPMGTGIASSASAFAALSLAATAAAGLNLSERELSALARLGSGSAARSVPGGFVEWIAGDSHETSYAYSIAPPEHWDLRDVVAIVSHIPKPVGSTDGHAAALTSPYFATRLALLPDRHARLKQAILERDLAVLGPLMEEEAISLHVIALTSHPPIYYWAPATLELMLAVRAWRGEGLPVYFTLDAGPNVHLICTAADAPIVEARVRAMAGVRDVLVNAPGGPATLISDQECVTRHVGCNSYA